MHGYDVHGPPATHGPLGGHAPPTPGPPGPLGPPPADMAHPDSTDSYVTYLESDDSLHHDAPSP